MIVEINNEEEVVAIEMTERGEDNPFKSGNTGFFAGGKVTIGGRRYQVTCSMVELK